MPPRCHPGANLVPTWCKPGANLVLTWCQPGANPVPTRCYLVPTRCYTTPTPRQPNSWPPMAFWGLVCTRQPGIFPTYKDSALLPRAPHMWDPYFGPVPLYISACKNKRKKIKKNKKTKILTALYNPAQNLTTETLVLWLSYCRLAQGRRPVFCLCGAPFCVQLCTDSTPNH